MTVRPATPDVLHRLGARLDAVARAGDADPRALLGLAVRDNPRRAHLLVSRALGKHVPADPRLVLAAGRLLGARVADVLAGRPPRPLPVELLHAALRGEPGATAALPRPLGPTDAVVLGFAETATGLGHAVAETLAADQIHSTRRNPAGVVPFGGFTEEHSHATEHLLLPADPALLAGPRPLVLVDDELSTGRTVVNTITALHRLAARERYVVAALVDVRETALAGLPDGIRVDVVSLARARVGLPPDIAERAAGIRREHRTPQPRLDGRGSATRSSPDPDSRVRTPRLARTQTPARGTSARESGSPDHRVGGSGPGSPLVLPWPDGVPVGARYGFTRTDHRAWDRAVPAAAGAVAAHLRPGERTLVLGTEELMALPLRLAAALTDRGHDVAFSTTTRSPALVVDEPGYALRGGIAFGTAEGLRFAYNVAQGFDHVLVVTDTDEPALAAALDPHCGRVTTAVVRP